MDTKLPKNLDPKLKEVYDRVMSFTPQAQNPPSQKTPPSPDVQTPPKSSPIATQIPIPPPAPVKTTQFVPSQTKTASSPEKKQKHVSFLILGVLAVVFLAVYAFFWLKLFHVKLPLLP